MYVDVIITSSKQKGTGPQGSFKQGQITANMFTGNNKISCCIPPSRIQSPLKAADPTY
jgi:hypothetical protein